MLYWVINTNKWSEPLPVIRTNSWKTGIPYVFHGVRRRKYNLLSLGTTGLEDPPAEVLPTGLECLGPRPGIFSPLDLSIFILEKQGDGRDLRAPPWVMKACGSGTRCGSGGCRSPCLAVGIKAVLITGTAKRNNRWISRMRGDLKDASPSYVSVSQTVEVFTGTRVHEITWFINV